MSQYCIADAESRAFRAVVPIVAVALGMASFVAFAQRQPDAGQILEQTREPLRLPPRTEPDVRPRVPDPRPALPGQPQLKVKVAGFTFTGNTIYPEATLHDVVAEFVGQELDFEGLNEAATKVRAYYRSRGYFLAQAYLPQQAIRGGSVQIAVIEGRLGIIELDRGPESRLSTRLLSGIIGAHLGEGDIITETGLERPLLLINDLPTAQVISEIRPSRTVGAADLRVNVDRSTSLVDGFVDFDNHGNRFTGEFRTGVSANLNNPVGWGDQVSFRGFRTSGMWYARLAYLVPVTYYGTRLGVSYTKFDYLLGKDFKALQANGEGEVASVYAFHPVLRTRNSNAILQASYEKKDLEDRVGQTGSVEVRDIQAAKLGMVGDFRDGFFSGGLNSFSFTYTHGELDISPAAILTQDQAATGRRTAGRFYKVNLDARRLQRVGDNVNLLLSYSAQKANKNLASAEKMSLGGPNAVRAYPVGEASGDSGFVVQSELRYIVPGFQFLGADVTVSSFFDYGHVRVNEISLPTDAEKYRTISGYGFGLSLGREGDFVGRLDVAWPYSSDLPQADTVNRDPRAWLQLVKWF